MAITEDRFRALLDAHGVLRPGAFQPPDAGSGAALAVFAQRKDASLDMALLKTQARRFFDAKLGLTVDKHYGLDARGPSEDVAHVVLATDDGTAGGTRLCYGRPARDVDLAAAETAERLQGTSGMALLAQRCPTVWLVLREADDDRASLTIAAILASAFLGPILSPDGDELFGVRTARLKLEGRRAPYR